MARQAESSLIQSLPHTYWSWLVFSFIAIAGIILRVFVAAALGTAAIEMAAGSLLSVLCMLAVYRTASFLAPPAGALVSAAYISLLPLAVSISHAPGRDLLGLAGLCLAIFFLVSWQHQCKDLYSVAGILFLGGAVAASPYLIPMAAALAAGFFLPAWRRQKDARLLRWVILAGIACLLPAASYLFQGGLSLDSARLLVAPKHYFAWASLVDKSFNLWLVYLGLWSIFLLPAGGRVAVLSLWAGYLLTGLVFPAAAVSEPPASASLVPLVAITLAPAAGLVWSKASRLPRPWRIAFYAAMVIFFGIAASFAWHDLSAAGVQAFLAWGVS